MLLSMSIVMLFCVKLDKQSFVRNVSAKLAFLSLPQHFYQRSSSPCLSFMEATLLLRFSVHYVNVTKTHTEGLLKLSWDLLKIDLLLVVFNFLCSVIRWATVHTGTPIVKQCILLWGRQKEDRNELVRCSGTFHLKKRGMNKVYMLFSLTGW